MWPGSVRVFSQNYSVYAAIAAGLFLLSCGIRILYMKTIHTPHPHLLCREPTFNFGRWTSDQPVEHIFVLCNVGDAPLQILRVKTNCVCTAVPMFQVIILPGRSAILPVRLDFGITQSGNQQHCVLVESDDPTNPWLPLRLIGVVARITPGASGTAVAVQNQNKDEAETLNANP
jgi:hypothetical protein